MALTVIVMVIIAVAVAIAVNLVTVVLRGIVLLACTSLSGRFVVEGVVRVLVLDFGDEAHWACRTGSL